MSESKTASPVPERRSGALLQWLERRKAWLFAAIVLIILPHVPGLDGNFGRSLLSQFGGPRHALLLQLTTNLLHNAIVHNLPKHGTVQVNTAIGPESVMLTVENTGDKLTPQLVSTLTEPFQRGAERIRSDHARVGLGLAIVKSITQAHDGTLTLTPRAAGGLRATVQLPPAPPHTGLELKATGQATVGPRSSS